MENLTNILIVDDSRIFRDTLKKCIATMEKVRVCGSVFNGVKALSEIVANRPDIILLDHEMPEMSGMETLHAISALNKTDKTQSPMRVIMMFSADTPKGNILKIKSLEAGAIDFILKPKGMGEQASIASLSGQLAGKITGTGRVVKTPAILRSLDSINSITDQKRSSFTPQSPSRFEAICIGVSTGGPKALHDMLPKLCDTVDVPIFIVQHMPETFTKSLAENLNKNCSSTVKEATNNDPVENGMVYLARGGRHMIVKRFANQIFVCLTDSQLVNGCRPSADTLFESASLVFGGNIIGIILTGMGNDGTAGVGLLKEKGAYIIVQDERTSVVWGMPGCAVASGHVDEILELNAIPERVSALILNRKECAVDLPEKSFSSIQQFIKNLCGIKITEGKQYLVQHRLAPIIEAEGCTSFEEFTQRLKVDAIDANLKQKIINAITTNETSFFRDITPFETFKEYVCPFLVEKLQKRMRSLPGMEAKMRIWCVASSTGQEPYSLSMLIHEFLEEVCPGLVSMDNFIILATDISLASLDIARKGTYSEYEMGRGLSAERKMRFFQKTGSNWKINENIMKPVEFMHLNLTHPFASKIGQIDIIVCRNVLIYFDDSTRPEIFKQFNSMLAPDGYLLLGSTENILAQKEKFVAKRLGKTTVYQKRV